MIHTPELEVITRRTSAPLRVAIVGAGIIGINVAFELQKRGHQVTIYETGAHLTPNPGGSVVWNWLEDGRDEVVSDLPVNQYRIKAVGGTALHWGGTIPRLEPDEYRDWLDERYYLQAETLLGSYNHAPSWFEDQHFIPALKTAGFSFGPMPNTKSPDVCEAFSTCTPYCPTGARYNPLPKLKAAKELGGVLTLTHIRDLRKLTTVFDAVIVCAGTVESTRLALLADLEGGSYLMAHMAAQSTARTPYPTGNHRIGYPCVVCTQFDEFSIAVNPLWGPEPDELIAMGRDPVKEYGRDMMLSSLCAWELDKTGTISLSPNRVDKWGDPVPVVELSPSMRGPLAAWAAHRELLELMNASPLLTHMGVSTDHLAGSMYPHVDRLGKHDQADNIYFLGNAVLPTIGKANPTLTALAHALQAVDHVF